MGMQPANHPRTFECDSCDYEVGGYSKSDLLTEGWTFHKVNVTRDLVLCDECTQRYSVCWEAKTAA
jgi:hypothetical protein